LHRCTLKSTHDLQSIATAIPRQYPYLLDSAAPGPLGEYSLLLRFDGEQLCKHGDGSITGPGNGNSFLSRLNDWYLQEKNPQYGKGISPFSGGWFVYLGYEDQALLEQMRTEIENLPVTGEPVALEFPELLPEPPEAFKQAVGKIHEYILDGDVFQVNLSRGWHGEFSRPADAASLYRSLRKSNPAPFAGMVRWGDHTLMSSSPERLVHLHSGQVQSRPIAGTHPRGEDSDSDHALSRELLAHPKERAEHIMLIDLERNDLGRVCETGTVEVDELMVVETYEHVHHIVSNVRGRLREGLTPVDVIRAVFPGGTITGCPKVRCMEIIAELEQHGRSFYTGSFGYMGLDGSMDLNILIRSMLLHKNHISFRTGAGIVVDSDPDTEVAETQHKARGLLRALGNQHA